jgi:hypothetical protein
MFVSRMLAEQTQRVSIQSVSANNVRQIEPGKSLNINKAR